MATVLFSPANKFPITQSVLKNTPALHDNLHTATISLVCKQRNMTQYIITVMPEGLIPLFNNNKNPFICL